MRAASNLEVWCVGCACDSQFTECAGKFTVRGENTRDTLQECEIGMAEAIGAGHSHVFEVLRLPRADASGNVSFTPWLRQGQRGFEGHRAIPAHVVDPKTVNVELQARPGRITRTELQHSLIGNQGVNHDV